MNNDQGHSQTLGEEVEINEGAQKSNELNETNVTGQAPQQLHTTSSNISVNLTGKVVIGKKRKSKIDRSFGCKRKAQGKKRE